MYSQKANFLHVNLVAKIRFYYMKKSTNFAFLIKVLALFSLLVVGYTKDDLFNASGNDEEKMEPFDKEVKSIAEIQLLD